MAGNERVARWIAEKLKEEGDFAKIEPLGSGFLTITRKGQPSFTAAAIGVDDVVTSAHVTPVFGVDGIEPEFVVNVPSKAIWEGEAIDFIHDQPAAWGNLGDLIRASRDAPVSSYRNKQYRFFEQAFRQHDAVENVARLYDRVYRLHRSRSRADLTIVLVDAYDMSAEDVRHARDLYGAFDVAVKMTSYGSVTSAATATAASMGAQALKFGELMGRLHKK